MKRIIYAVAAMALSIGVAHADDTKTLNKTEGKDHTVGAVGALGNVSKTGVATDPQQVKEQSGHTKASPGTVGAAPMAPVPSSNASH